ncbi:MAG: hypothetical protein QF451_06180 [Nitrospinota bacterium]|nr:hypothetical protein [Nitrospinota bacterium]
MMFKKLIGIGIIAAVGMVAGITDPALAQDKGLQETQDKGLRDKGLVDRDPLRYSDEVKGMKEVIERPKPLVEWGQGYLKPGPYCCEFELPTGMVISPNLLIFGNFRTGPQAIDNGVDPSSIEWVNTFDVFANLRLTGTERIFFGMSPLTKKSGSKTRYVFQPDDTLDTEFNARLTTAFFEGELSEMFPKLDWFGTKPHDWEIAVGRQPVFIHDGLLIQDTMDSIAITRSTVPLPGTQFARIGGIFGWDGVNRSNNKEDTEAYLLGLFSAMDVGHHTLDFDMVYVDSDQDQGDQFNIALGATQRIILFNTHFDTTFRIAGSLETDNETKIADDGALLFSSIAFAPPTTDPWDNIAYVNLFLAIDSYKVASRKSGGPLGLTGLLFAGNGLASFTPISNQATESYGGAIGYQMFFSPTQRTNLIMEIGGRKDDSPTGFNAYGIGAKISQAIGQHTFVSLDVFGIKQEGKKRDTRHGLRSELNIIF